MSDLPARIDRREFLKVTALAGGGLLVAVSGVACSRRAPAKTLSASAFVRVDPSGAVTVTLPKVEMGQGTYTALPMLVAEELEVALKDLQLEFAPADPAVYGFDGDQSTGGSTSVMVCWEPLRRAGAVTRTLLVQAAAQIWGVDPKECRAQGGAVLHTGSGRGLGYGALAGTAATLPVPKTVPLKPASEFRLIGRATPRLDVPEKVDGRARFGIDCRMPGLLFARVAIAPTDGARVSALDEAGARAVPGVRQVVNLGDVVAVVADHTHAANQGLAKLAVRWDRGKNGGVSQAMLVQALDQASQKPGALAAQSGDVASAYAHAKKRVEAVYHQPFLAHATMEPMNCTVHVTPERCEIWVGTQAPDRAVALLAPLGLKPENIRLHNFLIGGGFGRRLDVDGIVLAVRVGREVKAPVQVIYSREDDIRHDVYRPYYVDRIAAGLDALGQPVAWRHTVAGSSVDARWTGQPNKNDVDQDAVTAAAEPVYTLPNREVRYVRQEPGVLTTGYWRGVGPTRSVFVIESFIDELAKAAGQDPLAYRQALIKEPRLRAMLETVAGKANWGEPLPKGRGRGIAVHSAFGSHLALVAQVSVGDSIQLERMVCGLDCGQTVNPPTVHAQLESGMMFGASAALWGEITVADGAVEQGNFDSYRVLRMGESPRFETVVATSSEAPGGVGETACSAAAAALANAVAAATGRRLRTLPLARALKA
jgi:isoquinoline 1-oxidoreductase subunit beta